MFTVIADTPIRENPHVVDLSASSSPPLLLHAKKNDDCTIDMAHDDPITLAYMEQGELHNNNEYTDEYTDYNSDAPENYDDGFTDIPLYDVQVGTKSEHRVPWTTPREFTEYVYHEAKWHKARVLGIDLDSETDGQQKEDNQQKEDGQREKTTTTTTTDVTIEVTRHDFCYNMMCMTEYYAEYDAEPTDFWWIPVRHPVGQVLIRFENNHPPASPPSPATDAMYYDGEEDDEYNDSDNDYYYNYSDDDEEDALYVSSDADEQIASWMSYDFFPSPTGNVIVYEAYAVQEALDYIIGLCKGYGLPVVGEDDIVPIAIDPVNDVPRKPDPARQDVLKKLNDMSLDASPTAYIKTYNNNQTRNDTGKVSQPTIATATTTKTTATATATATHNCIGTPPLPVKEITPLVPLETRAPLVVTHTTTHPPSSPPSHPPTDNTSNASLSTSPTRATLLTQGNKKAD